jgi:hypothetical protein
LCVLANDLLGWAIQKFGLSKFDLDGFRQDILEFSSLLPGAILRRCEAATNSHYHFDGRIKTKLLHVDYLMKHCQGIGKDGSHGLGIQAAR